jgi:hypothetical protein
MSGAYERNASTRSISSPAISLGTITELAWIIVDSGTSLATNASRPAGNERPAIASPIAP